MKMKIKHIGPFSYFRFKSKKENKNFLSVWITALSVFAFGWEWGSDTAESNPSYCIRLKHLNIFSYEKLKKGFIIYFMGFWYVK